MTSLLATATTAVIAALTGVPGIPAPQRIRLRALPEGTLRAVVVRPAQAEVLQESLSGYPVSWQISMAVECYAKASAHETPDAAIDALLQAVYAAIATDLTLGGRVVNVSIGHVVYDFDAAADESACATLHLSILQQAAPGTF